MGEPKRIAVIQIGTVKPVEKKDKRQLCHRFTLSLVRSTEKTCPEFSYTDLLKNTVEAEENITGDEKDPFSEQDKEEHDKLQALAQSFEEKYAPVKQKRKKKCNRIQEFVDLGDGYDDADPFIDNTEAYDELVPSCLTTQHGGFYINSGKLDFRAVSDSEDDFQSIGKKKFTKKNIITSDNESESLPKKRGPKKKFKDEDDIRKKKRKKLSSSDGMDKPILKRKKFEREGFRGIKLKKKRLNNVSELLNMTTSSPNSTAGNVINGSQSEMTTEKMEGKTVSAAALQNMESAIDSVISQSRKMGSISSDEDSQETSLKPHSSQGLGEEEKTKLPEHLPAPIPELIDKLKQAVCDSEMGKKKFFTPKVNQMLLQIENGSRQLPAGIRTSIYSHLAAYLPCSKETLIKRAKKLQLEQNDDKLREPVAKLKEVINNSMPALIEKHQAELQAVQQMKRERKLELRENGSTESDEETEKPDIDKQKRIMAPRRKFQWTQDARNLLHQIVQIKLNHYELSKIRSQTPEDYLKAFFEQELKPLWPQGWMQGRLLFKESRAIHQCWTNPSFKQRRSLTSTTGVAISSPQATMNGKSSAPISMSTTVLPSQASNMSVSLGANTALVPSVHKTCGSLSSSGESSDTSCSDASSPPTQHSTVAYEGTEGSSGVSGEKFFQPVAGSQAVSSTNKPHLTDMTTAPNACQYQASIKQSSLTGKDLSRDSLSIQKSISSVSTYGLLADSGIDGRPEASGLGSKIGAKPHLAAALQGMYFSTMVSSAQKSTHHTSHSFKGKSQDSLASLKDIAQSHHSVTNQGQKQTSPTCNNSASSLSSITSNKCQVKLSDVLLSNQKSQQNYQGIYQGAGSMVTSQEPQMTSSNQIRISSDGRSQKKTSAITSQSSATRASGPSGSVGGKKFQISPTDMSIIRAGLAQAATQMVLKAQEKQISSSGPKHTSPEQQVNQTAVKHTSPLGQQMDLSGIKRASPVSKENSFTQHNQKQVTVTSQTKQISPVMHQTNCMQSLEKSKKAVTSSAPRTSSAVSRGHSVQDKLSHVAHSTVAESGLFAIPGMPVTTSARTVAVNQVSSTSGIGNNRSSAHSSAQALSKTGINAQITSQSPNIHSASTGSESQRHVVHTQLPSSQLTDMHSPVLQTSSQHTSSVHTAAVTRPTSSPVSGTQHSLSVSLTTFRQTSHQPGNSHVTSSSHGTTNRTSSSSMTRHGTPSSQAAPSRIPSTGQHVTTSKQQQSNITSNNVVQASNSSRMQQPQVTATSRAHLSQTTYGQQPSLSTHVHHLQSTTSSSHVPHMSSSAVGSHSQQSQPVSSICNLTSNNPVASYNQMMSLHSRPDSTSSAAKNTEPKFGGLTLSQIQAQTLKASQKAHIQTAQQYNSQPASTSSVYRSPEGSSAYGVAQLRSPGQTSHSFPAYSNTSPSPHNPHQSPEPNNSGSNPYGILRTPPSLGHHNTSPAHRSSQNRY